MKEMQVSFITRLRFTFSSDTGNGARIHHKKPLFIVQQHIACRVHAPNVTAALKKNKRRSEL